MKKVKIIGIIILIFLAWIIGIGICNSEKEVRTIKSEKELYRIYEEQEYQPLTLTERLLTLPFSILLKEYRPYETRRYNRGNWAIVEDYDIKTGDATNETSKQTSTIKVPTTQKDYSKTNIQVEGVDEADIIKTDGDYIYSISEDKVIITNARDPKNIKIEAEINGYSTAPIDLLLYKDKLVIISTSTNSNNRNSNTLVEIYNIKNKTNPKKMKSFELYEPYYTTRCIDGKLYVFSQGYLRENKEKVDRRYKEDNHTKELNLKDIKYIKNNISDSQTLIAEVDLNQISNIKLTSYLIDISNAYVSKNNIYLLNEAYRNQLKITSLFTWKGVIGFFESLVNYIEDYDEYEEKTQIYKFKIDQKKGASLTNTTIIEGTTINQYSLDEKDGNLRIALETDDGTKIAILDKNLKLLGETDEVAEGENMYASRFIGDKAYLVTYLNTDPLFVVDLSDVKNPKVLGELKIPGYSTYLHPYDDNHIIGIGMDSKEEINRDSNGNVISSWARITGMKMCLFDVSDITNPKEIAKTKIGDSRTASAILTNPKALLFSKEKELLAIPVNNYEEDIDIQSSTSNEDEIDDYVSYNKNYISEGYFVYNINLKDGFTLKGTITHEKNNTKDNYYYYRTKLLRGLYIENNLYTISEEYIKVNELKDLKEVSSLNIHKKGEDKNEK